MLVSFIGVVEIFRTAQIKQAATFNFTPYVGVAARVPRRDDPARPVHRLAGRPRPEAPGRRRARRPMTPTRRRCPAIEGLHKSFGDARGPARDRPRRSPSTRSSASSARRGAASRRCCAASTCSSRSTPGGSSSRATRSPREGVDVDRIRRRIGIVFQAFNLFPHMSVLDNVTLAPRKVLGPSRARGRGARRRSCSRGSGSPTSATSSRTGCRAASSSGSRSSGRWR